MASTTGRRVVEYLTNKSGGAVIAGDIVILDSANDESFTTTATSGYTGTIGVALEAIANNASGRVCTSGDVALVTVNASVTRGNFGKTHSVAKQATDAGASRAAGAFCQWKKSGTSPSAHLFGLADSSTSSSGVPAGSAFPGSPATNDLYYRTDLSLLFFYNGTRWMTVILFVLPLTRPDFTALAATTATYARSNVPDPQGGTDIFVTAWNVDANISGGGTALGASHKWVGTLDKRDAAGTITSIMTINIDSGSSNTNRKFSNTTGVLLTPASYFTLADTWTKTGTPGNLSPYSSVSYRIVAT